MPVVGKLNGYKTKDTFDNLNVINAMNTASIRKTITGLKPEITARYKVKGIGLFGSFVRQEQDETSDIDILVEFEVGADLFDLVGLAQFLEEKLKRNVDVIPKNALRAELRESVLQEIVAL